MRVWTWACEEPWLVALTEAQAAGKFDSDLVERTYPEWWESEYARLSALADAASVLLPAAERDGNERLAGMLRARRIEYVDQLLAVRRTKPGGSTIKRNGQ